MGYYPWYSVDAVEPADVAAAVQFATKYNLRLVVKTTGHDINGRQTGYGSLNVWLRHYRHGIEWQDTFQSSTGCFDSGWKGSAMKIGGGYTWEDVYPYAWDHNAIIVGGGCPTVSCLGGWMQGGGHSPATHNYGLGADQVLEATVILANGSLLTVDACTNSDLFFAIRGGGPSTYGIVTSTTVKTYPTTNIVSQVLGIIPRNLTNQDEADDLLSAISILYGEFPYLSDNDYSGYGSWGFYSAIPLYGNSTVGYTHIIAKFNSTKEEAKQIMDPVVEKLAAYNSSLVIEITYNEFSTYHDYYYTENGKNSQIGISTALGSRMLGAKELINNTDAIRETLEVLMGSPEEYTSNNIELIGGGAVFADGADPFSGLNPYWRKAYMVNIVARGWIDPLPASIVAEIRDDVTNVKLAALQKLAPDMGGYMNEGDPFEADWKDAFYGAHYERLLEIKAKYDPDDLFYCLSCVGSDAWVQTEAGPLCRA